MGNQNENNATFLEGIIELDGTKREHLEYFFPKGVCVFDLETTGLSPLSSNIVEIAGVFFDPKQEEITTWSTLVNPEVPISESSQAIHHISDDMVQGSPTFEEAIPGFFERLEKRTLVAHNAVFDIGFLISETSKKQIELPTNNVLCSLILARGVMQAESHKLGNLAKQLGIDLSNHHRAQADANATFYLLAHLCQLANENMKNKVFEKANLFNLGEVSGRRSVRLPENLEQLHRKVDKQEIVEILYNGGSRPGKFRPIRPIGIIPMPKGPVIYGLCLLSGQNKSFIARKVAGFREFNEEQLAKMEKLAYELTKGKN